MNECLLRMILWQYNYYEFDINSISSNDDIGRFINSYKNDEIYIADSEFGYNVDYTGTTIFKPSELKIIKHITNLDTENSITLYRYFDNVEEVEDYFLSNTFDDHLQPSFDEHLLDKLTSYV